MDFLTIRQDLLNVGFSEEDIVKIVNVCTKNTVDVNNHPQGAIDITITPSRSRIGTTLIGYAIKRILTNLNYKINYSLDSQDSLPFEVLQKTADILISNPKKSIPRAVINLNVQTYREN